MDTHTLVVVEGIGDNTGGATRRRKSYFVLATTDDAYPGAWATAYTVTTPRPRSVISPLQVEYASLGISASLVSETKPPGRPSLDSDIERTIACTIAVTSDRTSSLSA